MSCFCFQGVKWLSLMFLSLVLWVSFNFVYIPRNPLCNQRYSDMFFILSALLCMLFQPNSMHLEGHFFLAFYFDHTNYRISFFFSKNQH